MKKQIVLTLASAALLATSIPAEAQRWGGNPVRPSVTLFAGINYTGKSVTINIDSPNLRDFNFDEAAGSLVARGDWEVCLDPNYGTRCRTYSGSIPDLRSFRGRISSVRSVGRGSSYIPGGGHGPGYGGGDGTPPRYSGQTTTGRSTVFFPGTIRNDSGDGRADANEFCRRQGLSSAVYSNHDRNGNLEDVLCRR